MPKYLNLDDLIEAPQRFLKFQDVEYPIVEQTVEGFIQATKLIEAAKEKDADDMANQVDLTIKLIMLSVPTIDESALSSRPLTTLGKIASFVRGIDEDEVLPVVEGKSEKK